MVGTMLASLLVSFLLSASPLTVKVEVVSKAKDLERGLQGRTSLDEGSGMLFVLPREQTAKFWMQGMKIPIDILFIDKSGIVTNIIREAVPCRESHFCPVFESVREVTHVLEVPANWAEPHGLFIGTHVLIDKSKRTVTVPNP